MEGRESLFVALARVVSPGENVSYSTLLNRLESIDYDTGGIGMKLHEIAFGDRTRAWRGSEFISYRVPYFDREIKGDWTEGELRIVRREAEE